MDSQFRIESYLIFFFWVFEVGSVEAGEFSREAFVGSWILGLLSGQEMGR